MITCFPCPPSPFLLVLSFILHTTEQLFWRSFCPISVSFHCSKWNVLSAVFLSDQPKTFDSFSSVFPVNCLYLLYTYWGLFHDSLIWPWFFCGMSELPNRGKQKSRVVAAGGVDWHDCVVCSYFLPLIHPFWGPFSSSSPCCCCWRWILFCIGRSELCG